MPFSPELPFAAVQVLVDVVTPGGKAYSPREVVEAGYDVLGYVLGQMLEKPVISLVDGLTEEQALKMLLLVKDRDGKEAQDIPWALIFALINKLIDIWVKK